VRADRRDELDDAVADLALGLAGGPLAGQQRIGAQIRGERRGGHEVQFLLDAEAELGTRAKRGQRLVQLIRQGHGGLARRFRGRRA